MDKLRDALRDYLYIEFTPISKLFFRKYAYKIEVNLERYAPKRLAKLDARNRWDFGVERARKTCWRVAGDFKVRQQKQFCSFYFQNEEDALLFIKANAPFITEIIAPENDGEKIALLNDETVRIRPSLFWGKYRWSVQLRHMKENEWVQLKETVAGAYATNEGEEPRCELQYGSPLKAYFNDHNDLLQFRIMASDHLIQIEKAVLRNEI